MLLPATGDKLGRRKRTKKPKSGYLPLFSAQRMAVTSQCMKGMVCMETVKIAGFWQYFVMQKTLRNTPWGFIFSHAQQIDKKGVVLQ